jgi:hypothetical protein
LNAASASLDAYAAIVAEATADAGNDVSAAATLETGVRSNLDVLAILIGRVPTEQARDAIQRAIDRSDSALDELRGKPTDTPGVGPDGNPTTNPQTDPTGGPDKTANPNKPTPDPAATPKPHPTPEADPTVNAQATPTPEHTPRGGPPSEPPGGGGGPQNSQGN